MSEVSEIQGASEIPSTLREFKIITKDNADKMKISFPLEGEDLETFILTGEGLMNPNKRNDAGRRVPSEARICCNNINDARNLSDRTLYVEQFIYTPYSDGLASAVPPRLVTSPEYLMLSDEQKVADDELEMLVKTPGEFVRIDEKNPNLPKIIQAIRARQKTFMMYCTDKPEDLYRYLPQVPRPQPVSAK